MPQNVGSWNFNRKIVYLNLATVNELRAAIQRECGQMPNELFRDVCDFIVLHFNEIRLSSLFWCFNHWTTSICKLISLASFVGSGKRRRRGYLCKIGQPTWLTNKLWLINSFLHCTVNKVSSNWYRNISADDLKRKNMKISNTYYQYAYIISLG